jgi:flagella basal body P-ring formation protein FlgA
MRRILSLLLVAVVPAVASSPETAPRAAHPLVPLATETFLSGLSRDLAAHFKLEGELQLEFIRPWAPPSRVAGEWTISIVEFPQVPSSSMLVRCRVLADGQPAAESTVVLRANHWREAWVTLQPIASGAAFDPTVLEPRRVDLFRDRDAVPVSVGDRTFVFSRALAAGRLLTWRDIARRPLVKKGQVSRSPPPKACSRSP